MKNKAISLLITILLSSHASAEIELGQYLLTKNMDQVKTYVTGIGKGVFWTNTYLTTLKRDPLFCMPDNIEINQSIIISILNAEIKNENYDPDDYIESIIPLAFMKKFPCS